MPHRYLATESGIDPHFGMHCGLPHHFKKANFELHSHDFWELVVVLEGSGQHLTSYGDYRISAGDVFVIHGDTVHGFVDSTGMVIMNFLMTEWYLEETNKWLKQLPGYHALFVLEPIFRHREEVRNRFHLKPKDLRHASRIIERAYKEYEAKQPAYRAIVTGLWQELLAYMCRAFNNIPNVPFSPLADTVAYMEEQFNEVLQLEDLAERAHMSKNHFIRVFKQYYHMTPNKYLNQLRIERAKEQLLSSDLNMTEIALACGFGDSNYFARMFKQAQGCSPRAYRQEQQSLLQ